MSAPGYLEFDALACAHGPSVLRGRLKQRPESFVVGEVLGYAPEGSGDHAWLRIRKRNTNTDWLARQLARHSGVALRDVGYAGQKDRRAITTQWFSVDVAGRNEPNWQGLECEDLAVLEVTRHRRKLRRGALAGNRFCLQVDQAVGDRAAIDERLQRIARLGVPNYFGPQRFGRAGGNVEAALQMLQGRQRVRDRYRRGLYLSVARALLFNRLLDRRVRDATWNRMIGGDLVMLEGTNSFFAADDDEELPARLERLDLHPTGPLWGDGEPPTSTDARELELTMACEPWREGLASARVESARRALRLRVQALEWSIDDDAVRLEFTLRAGAYATVVLREALAPMTGEGD